MVARAASPDLKLIIITTVDEVSAEAQETGGKWECSKRTYSEGERPLAANFLVHFVRSFVRSFK